MREAYLRQYRDFWDYPRIFLVSFEGSSFLFDCKFDEKIEDYGNEYDVYSMPPLDDEALSGSWDRLIEKSIRLLGRIPIDQVRFDETRRSFIDGEVILQLLR